ncbi:hypothetical protein OAQ34_09255 [Opitutales bacterium]|jgi:hypothetical protein|uniref:hypothetical protein n=1 Tax=Candidatus Seribacter sulfatis TaxID=3381756 RepID=UPI002A17CC02|nr:hypothetical protein [Opitutales bacterium]
MTNESHERLAVFRSDSGITLSFGPNTYFIDSSDPFHNIALKALAQDDYVPFYIEIAKREGLGPEFRDTLMREIENLADSED